MNIDARPSPRFFTQRLAAGLVVAFTAGCGGGGGDGASAPAAAAPVAPVAPASSPGAGPGTTASSTATGTCNLAAFATNMLARVNQYRAAGASCGVHGAFASAPALAWNLALSQAADAHSRDMAANNFFSHTGSSGSSAGQRISAAGYNWSAYGENIAAGQAGINEVVDGWMASDGHCANIMNAAFADIGVACVPGTASTSYRSYWTMDLGKSR